MHHAVSKLGYFLDTIFVEDKANEVDWLQFFTVRYSSDLALSTFSRVENDLYMKKKPLVKLYLMKSVDVFCTECGIQAFNAAQAICDVMQHVCQRISKKADAFIFLLGSDSNQVVQRLSRRCASLMRDACKLSRLSLHLTVCILSGNRVPSLVNCLISADIYDSIFSIVADPELRCTDGPVALLLLTLLVNERRSTNCNCLLEKVSMECNESSLEGYESVISNWLVDCVNSCKDIVINGTQSLLGSLMSTFLAIGEEKSSLEFGSKTEEIENLLALYYAVRFNHRFPAVFATIQRSAVGSIDDVESLVDTSTIANFITYCSFIIHDSKSEYARRRSELCLLVLLCVVENAPASASMHDTAQCLSIALYRPPMLHREGQWVPNPPPSTAASALCDLIYEFIMSHMRLSFPFHLYELAIGIIHRMVAYEKRMCFRMTKWKPIFEALVSLLNFMASNETQLGVGVYRLCVRVMVLLNLFITYGDTFLPNDVAYDHMCYEIIRQEAVFRKLLKSTAKLRETSGDVEERSKIATRVLSQLENPLEIVNHFKDKLAQVHNSNFSEEEVLEVVRTNFDSLHLKLYEGLETAQPYDFDAVNELLDVMIGVVRNNSLKRYAVRNFDYSDMLHSLSRIESPKVSS